VRICLIIDKWGWTYDRIAQALIKFNKSEHQFEVLAAKTDAKKIKRSKADRFLVMGYQCWEKVDFLPKDRTFVGVHGHHQWDGHKTTPTEDVEPSARLHEFLQSFRGVNVVSEKLLGLFPYAAYTPNGVDTEMFRRERDYSEFTGDVVRVGCAYNPKHDWRKGVKDIIEPACDEEWAEVVLAPRNKKLHEMPAWYNSIDVYVCASSSEGLSLSVLEALACDRVIVSTIRNEIDTQMIVDRTPEALRLELFDSMDTPFLVAMSKKAEAEAKERWSWERRVTAWTDFLGAE